MDGTREAQRALGVLFSLSPLASRLDGDEETGAREVGREGEDRGERRGETRCAGAAVVHSTLNNNSSQIRCDVQLYFLM